MFVKIKENMTGEDVYVNTEQITAFDEQHIELSSNKWITFKDHEDYVRLYNALKAYGEIV